MLILDALTITFEQGDEISADLTLSAGEICAVTGPSGVGKSTLLLTLAGFHAARSGDMTWQGDSFATKPVWERPLSLLFQSDNLFGHISAFRNIALSAPKQLKRHEISAKIDEITKKLHISDVLTKPASQLSGGQQQRVGLARALLADKPILLLDEPFSALDKENRHAALELVKEITRLHQLVTVIVTHDHDDIDVLGARTLPLIRRKSL